MAEDVAKKMVNVRAMLVTVAWHVRCSVPMNAPTKVTALRVLACALQASWVSIALLLAAVTDMELAMTQVFVYATQDGMGMTAL